MLKIDEIKEIIKMVSELPIQHFEIDHEGTKIVIDKNNSLSANEKSAEIHTSLKARDIGVKTPAEEVTIEQLSEKILEENKREECSKITSPMLGTFYSSPEPGEAPFVKIGDKVNVNTVVCILESMKLFNDIEAGIKGEIVEVLVKDGEFVEYGQPLFLVKSE
jgi:acetyl-CoA carboxylase biotin carboxyl carrier protein